MTEPLRVAITIDVEHDCPPFMQSCRGMEEGMPRLLDLFAADSIPVTFFTTGDMARRFPQIVERIVGDGHELGCHGDTHKRFSAMLPDEAQREIESASATLRRSTEVVSFRAPNLDLPEAYLPLLSAAGYAVDSSRGRHKLTHRTFKRAIRDPPRQGLGLSGALRAADKKIWDDAEQGTYHFCYISLITDYYTKEIIGYSVGESLSTRFPLKALNMALMRMESYKDIITPIHHSDRGVQYASNEYIKLLREYGIIPSMTECGNPKDNAVAERVNNTLKNELFMGLSFTSLQEVEEALERAVHFYNELRPHGSIGMLTPKEAAKQKGSLKKNWTSYREKYIKSLSVQEK